MTKETGDAEAIRLKEENQNQGQLIQLICDKLGIENYDVIAQISNFVANKAENEEQMKAMTKQVMALNEDIGSEKLATNSVMKDLEDARAQIGVLEG